MQAQPPSPARGLWRDERPLTSRLLLSLPVALGWGVTFFIFGILDLYLQNRSVLTFQFADIAPAALLLGLAVTICMFAALALLKGRVLDAAVSLLWGMLVAGYMQGTFLNLPLGALDGNAIAWQTYRAHALINVLIWGVIIALPFALKSLAPRAWRLVIPMVPLVLIGMQAAGLVSTLAAAGPPSAARNRYLSEAGMFEMSTQDNILVFVVDCMDTRFIDEIMGQTEDFFDALDGFTFYRDTVSLYSQTYPSLPYLLTGQECHYTGSMDQYMREAYASTRFLPTLRDDGYAIKLYTQEKYTYSDIAQLEGLADNILDGKVQADVPAILSQMSLLSGFRYMPHALKPSFFMSTAALEGLMQMPDGLAPYALDDIRIYQRLMRDGLTTRSDKKNFTLIHMFGSHSPYVMNEKIEPVPEGFGDQYQQTRGCFQIIYAFMSQLKDLGLYEDATVLIMGDHGDTTRGVPLGDYRLAALFYKPSGVAEEPLAYSDAQISHRDFQATILANAGLDYADYGRVIDDIPEDEDRVRDYFHRVEFNPPKPLYQQHFHVEGYGEDFEHWHLVDEIPMEYNY